MVTEGLKSGSKCNKAATMANKIQSTIKKTVRTKDSAAITRLNKSLARRHFKYTVQACSPQLRRNIDRLETVQRSATKMIVGMENLSFGG